MQANKSNKLLVLDIAGTILVGGSVDPELNGLLETFNKNGFIIVTATNAQPEELEGIKQIFIAANIFDYFSAFQPKEAVHFSIDKKRKIDDYVKAYQPALDDVYFFDDTLINVKMVKTKFPNAVHITENNSLIAALKELAEKLKIGNYAHSPRNKV